MLLFYVDTFSWPGSNNYSILQAHAALRSCVHQHVALRETSLWTYSLLYTSNMQRKATLRMLASSFKFFFLILLWQSRDLLDDSAFAESLMVLASRPPIYECQTSATPPITFPSSPQHSVQSNWTVDGEAAVCLGKISQIQATAESKHAPSDLAEAVLLKTLQNLMMEAVTGELTLFAYPRSKIRTSLSARWLQCVTCCISAQLIVEKMTFYVLCSVRGRTLIAEGT